MLRSKRSIKTLMEIVFEGIALGLKLKETSRVEFRFRKKIGFQLFITAIFEWIGYDVSE
jgi:hypothetical protein